MILWWAAVVDVWAEIKNSRQMNANLYCFGTASAPARGAADCPASNKLHWTALLWHGLHDGRLADRVQIHWRCWHLLQGPSFWLDSVGEKSTLRCFVVLVRLALWFGIPFNFNGFNSEYLQWCMLLLSGYLTLVVWFGRWSCHAFLVPRALFYPFIFAMDLNQCWNTPGFLTACRLKLHWCA